MGHAEQQARCKASKKLPLRIFDIDVLSWCSDQLPPGRSAIPRHHYASLSDPARNADPASLCFHSARNCLQHIYKMRLLLSTRSAHPQCACYIVDALLLEVSLTVTYWLQGWPCKSQHHDNCPLGYADSSYGLLQLQVPVLTCLQTRPLRATAKGETTWVQSGA